MKTFNTLNEELRARIKTPKSVPMKRGEFDSIKTKKQAIQLFFRLYSGKSRTRLNWQTMIKSLKDSDDITKRQADMWRSEYQSEWVDA